MTNFADYLPIVTPLWSIISLYNTVHVCMKEVYMVPDGKILNLLVK